MAGRVKRIVGTAKEDWWKNPDKEATSRKQTPAKKVYNASTKKTSSWEDEYKASYQGGEFGRVRKKKVVGTGKEIKKTTPAKNTYERPQDQPGERQYQSGDRGGSYGGSRPGGSYDSKAAEKQRKDNEQKKLQSKMGSAVSGSRGDSLYSRDSTSGQTKKVETKTAKKTETKKTDTTQKDRFESAFKGYSEEEKKKREKMGSRNNNW